MPDTHDAASAHSHHGLFGYPENTEEILSNPKNVDSFLRQKKSKEAQDVLQRLRILDEVIPQIVWTADPDGYQDYFNRHWFSYTGLTPDETYAGKSALHPDDFPHYVERWTTALRTGEAYEAEYRFRRASDGAYRWHLVRGVPIRNTAGKIVKWLGTFTDIHEQKQTQENLATVNRQLATEIERSWLSERRNRANLERLKNVIAIMPTGAIVADEEGRILHMNERCRTIFSISETQEEWTGRSLQDFFGAAEKVVEDCLTFRALCADLKTRSDMGDTKTELLLRDERIVVFENLPIIESGDARGHLLLFQDVTKERRIDTAKSEFMSLASHQLRTPLTSIRWALEWLGNQGAEEGVVAEILRDARRSASHMADSINMMLFISRVEADDLSLEYADVDIRKLLEELLSRYESNCRKKNLNVLLEAAAPSNVRTDRKLLEEILENLVTNAIKYSLDGGRIAVRASPVPDGLRIDVTDHGLGIPKAQHDKVFKKFFRAENVLSVATEGTGLGLYLASSLSKLLGGSLSFVSAEGAGTTFSLVLPRTAESS